MVAPLLHGPGANRQTKAWGAPGTCTVADGSHARLACQAPLGDSSVPWGVILARSWSLSDAHRRKGGSCQMICHLSVIFHDSSKPGFWERRSVPENSETSLYQQFCQICSLGYARGMPRSSADTLCDPERVLRTHVCMRELTLLGKQPLGALACWREVEP